MILSFIIGAGIGFKLYEIFIILGLQSMAQIEDSGIQYIEEENKLILDMDKISLFDNLGRGL